MRVCVVVGTRPEIIKMASIITLLRSHRRDFVLLHTGQHYTRDLSQVFFEELGLPEPHMNLEIESGTHAEQTARALVRLERAFEHFVPDIILVEGDTNTVLAAALAGCKLGIRVGHVEAGLRSYDLRMPEEHNRRLTDHLSAYLFAPTKRASGTLRREKCWGKISVTGNTVIDACMLYGPKANTRSHLASTIEFDHFALATTHRAENVDNPEVLKDFVRVLNECPIPVVYSIHPRTRLRLKVLGLSKVLTKSRNVQILPPQGYIDFLWLMMHCSFVLTDSGGIQEEATSPNIRKKVFVMRKSTERPESVQAGYAEIVGLQPDLILQRLQHFMREKWKPLHNSPFGKGQAGKKILDIIERHETTQPGGHLCGMPISP